jgi:hypothetical protein
VKVFYGAGLNENQYPHPSEAASGSYNFDLRKDSSYLFPRVPFDVLATATNGADGRGLLQLIKRDDTETTLVQAGDTVYKWDGATTFTSKATLVTAVSQLRDTYWSLGDYLVITDLQKHTPVSKWDGTTFSTLTTGLGSSLFAKYGIVHKGRVWLFNVKTTTDTPHLMVASAFENPISYSTTDRAVSTTFVTGSEAFYMLTPDLKPINGVGTFHGDLVISTEKGRLFRLSGSSSIDYKWTEFYANSFAIGNEAMTDGGNDLYYMRSGGNIESLTATQQYGDVSVDDLSRWIPDTVKNLTSAIAVYDRTNQKVLFFTGNSVLVLYKDLLLGGCVVDETGNKAKLSPWSVYKTSHSSGFNTSAAKYIRLPGTMNYSVLFTDTSGRIYDLNGAGSNGDSGNTNITSIRKTRFLGKESGLDFRRKIPEGVVRYTRTRSCVVSVEFDWSDEYNTSTSRLTLNQTTAGLDGPYFGGGFYFGDSVYFGPETAIAGVKSKKQFSPVGRGEVVNMTVTQSHNVVSRIDNIEIK